MGKETTYFFIVILNNKHSYISFMIIILVHWSAEIFTDSCGINSGDVYQQVVVQPKVMKLVVGLDMFHEKIGCEKMGLEGVHMLDYGNQTTVQKPKIFLNKIIRYFLRNGEHLEMLKNEEFDFRIYVQSAVERSVKLWEKMGVL